MSQPAISMRPPSALIPYARNARTHSEQQVAMIAGSIREFGFRNPVLVDAEDGIIAGHARVQAALQLGLAKVPCIDCSDMSDTQRRAYILAVRRWQDFTGEQAMRQDDGTSFDDCTLRAA